MIRTILLIGVAAIALAACNEGRPTAQSASTLANMSVAFNWCAAGSPSFRVANVPPETKTLRLKMVDRNVPTFNHGGGDVAFSGRGSAMIPCGAISGAYNGPNPPPPQVHDYQWTVTALDGSGTALATGNATRKFPE